MESPWNVPENGPVAELEFKRRALEEFRAQTRAFAAEKGITCEVNTDRDKLEIKPLEGDFEILAQRIRELAQLLNDMLANHGKTFSLELEEYPDRLTLKWHA